MFAILLLVFFPLKAQESVTYTLDTLQRLARERYPQARFKNIKSSTENGVTLKTTMRELEAEIIGIDQKLLGNKWILPSRCPNNCYETYRLFGNKTNHHTWLARFFYGDRYSLYSLNTIGSFNEA